MANQEPVRIAPAEGTLGVLIPGMGAVTTTFIAGLEAIKRGLGKPIGSLTQLGKVRLGKRTEGRSPAIKDSPLVLDIVLLMDVAQRAGRRGVQEWLSFYFKAPTHGPEVYPEHDIFIQLRKLKNMLRWMRGEDLITHLGLEYYD